MPWIASGLMDQRMEADQRSLARDMAYRLRLFQPRWKRYASWPAVLWCRLRRHKDQGQMHSGDVSRCIGCGDEMPDSIYRRMLRLFDLENDNADH